MSELTDIDKAVFTLMHLLDSRGPPPEDPTKPVPIEFGEYSDFAMMHDDIATDLTWSWHYWNQLHWARIIEEIDCHTYVSIRGLSDYYEMRKDRLEPEDDKDEKKDADQESKIDFVMKTISGCGRVGASFNKLLRLGMKNGIERIELINILNSLKCKRLIHEEDGMYVLL